MSDVALLLIGAVLGGLASKTAEWILDWYRYSRGPKVPALIKADDITSWVWNGRKLLKELINIDKRVLGNELTLESREGTIDQWSPLFLRDTEGWGALAINKRIIGYFSFFALSDAAETTGIAATRIRLTMMQ